MSDKKKSPAAVSPQEETAAVTEPAPAVSEESAANELNPVSNPVSEPETPAEPAKIPNAVPEKTEAPYLYYVRIASVLAVICVLVALLLAVVNAVTGDIILENIAREKEKAILAIFPQADSTEPYSGTLPDSGSAKVTVNGVSLVMQAGEEIGYCADVTSSGFSGGINMMVGVYADGQTAGVQIVSMSETPGLGSKASDEAFLKQFTGKSGTLTAGGDIDAISGATMSSKAVIAGVNAALALRLSDADVPANTVSTPETMPVPQETDALPETTLPVETVPAEQDNITQPPETQLPETQPPETQPPETQPPETRPPETQPPETQPPETQPPETQPPETQPPETQPPETEPLETEPLETEPLEIIQEEWRLW